MEEITDINPEDYKKEYVAKAGQPLPDGSEKASREALIEALKTVSDPEIMVNIWEMTVTSPMCPVAGVLPEQAAQAVSLVEGVGAVEVRIVWEPAWSFEMLSDEAKAMFELL